MSEYTSYDAPKAKKKKKAKVTPKSIFGIFCGTALLFILSFLLSYMLMNHSLPTVGGRSLAEENEALKERIEILEKRLEKYEDSDDFSQAEVPDTYTGATITPGGSEPAVNDSNPASEEKKNSDTPKDDKKETETEEESAFDGVIDEPEQIPANTGVSDAPVILN